MKVTICSCARCTAHGNEYLHDSAELVKKDVEIAYENVMDEVENSQRLSPIVKIDEEYITKAKPEVLMEKMYAELKIERDKRKSEINK